MNFTILDTTSFDFLLGMGFIDKPEIQGIMLKPKPRVLLSNGEEVLIEETSEMFKMSASKNQEAYKLHPELRKEMLTHLGVVCNIVGTNVACHDMLC